MTRAFAGTGCWNGTRVAHQRHAVAQRGGRDVEVLVRADSLRDFSGEAFIGRSWSQADRHVALRNHAVRIELESDRGRVQHVSIGQRERITVNHLGRVDQLPLIDEQLLEDGKRYRVRIRALLQTQQYSAPLRLLFFWRSQWQLKSEWYEWPLKR